MPLMQPKSDFKAAWFGVWGGSPTAQKPFEDAWNAKREAYNGQYQAAAAAEQAQMDARLKIVTDAEAAGQYPQAQAELDTWQAQVPALPQIRLQFAQAAAREAARVKLQARQDLLKPLPADLALPLQGELDAVRTVLEAADSTLEALLALPAKLDKLEGRFEGAAKEQAARPQRAADALLILRSLDQFDLPAAWTGAQADLARQGLKDINELLGPREALQAELPPPLTVAALRDAHKLYDQFTDAHAAARAVQRAALENARARGELEGLIDDLKQRLPKLRQDVASGFEQRMEKPLAVADDAQASTDALRRASATLQDIDAESLALALEDANVVAIAKAVGGATVPPGATRAQQTQFEDLRARTLVQLRTAALLPARQALAALEALAAQIAQDVAATRLRLETELQRLAREGDGPKLSGPQARKLADSLSLDELLALESSVGLASLGTLNEAFAPDVARPDSVAGVMAFKGFVQEGLGGDEALKTLLATGCQGDVAKLAAFGAAFKRPRDQAGLARLLGVGAPADAPPTGRLAVGTVAQLLGDTCGGDLQAFLALNEGLLADTQEAATLREQRRNLLEGSGLAGAPTVLKGLVPPGKAAGKESGQGLGDVLGALGKAFDGADGARQFKTLLDAGFVPNDKQSADKQVKPGCLGELLREGFGGSADQLAALAQGMDTEPLRLQVKALREQETRARQQLKALDKDAAAKSPLNAQIKKLGEQYAAAKAQLDQRNEGRFGALLVDAGLGRHPEVLAQAVKGGCGGQADKLLAVAQSFDTYAARNGLRVAVEEGGLGGGAGESPELLGDVLGHGLEGDGAKLKDMAVAFTAKPGQLKEMIGVYKEPPHGPPPGGPGAQLKALLAPNILDGDAALLQTRFTASLAGMGEERRKLALGWAPEFKKERTAANVTDNVAVADAPKLASGKERVRLDHFAQRHAAANFDFNDIKAENSQWPPGTSAADIKGYVEAALNQWTTATQRDLDVTKKALVVDLPGGKKVAVQAAWDGAKLSQFVPLTRADAASAGLYVDAADYLESVENFSEAEMLKLKAALSPP